MDNKPEIDKELLQAAIKAARGHGLPIELTKGSRNRLVSVRYGKLEAHYHVHCARALRPASFGVALHQLDRYEQAVILITDHLAPELAEELKARDVPFLDAAGNVYIKQANLFIWVKGNKPLAKPNTITVGRAFQPTGLQVIFTLLCNPHAINLPYRELAKMAGVAHGTVGWVIPDLQQLGFVHDLQGWRGTRRLCQKERLLNQWTDAYVRSLRPRTLIGRYYVTGLEGWENWPTTKHAAQWGGEPAAAILTNYLRPGELTLYAERMPSLLAAQQKFIKDRDQSHTVAVDVRKRFWNFPAEQNSDTTTPPILIYADLLATGDARCIETAKIIYDSHIVQLLTEA